MSQGGEANSLPDVWDAHGAEISPPVAGPPVQIIRSAKRKRTLQARLVRGVIEVRVPAGMAADEEERQVADLVARMRRQLATDGIDLAHRACQLAAEMDLPEPEGIEWSDRMQHRWGSCSIQSRRIRISDRLTVVPDWVLDFVIVHELTHLVETDHSAKFHELMHRFPRAERAEGYLQAMSELEARGLLRYDGTRVATPID